MWGVFKAVADATMKLPDGKYLLVKDPNKPTLRTYEVPEDAFDDGYSKSRWVIEIDRGEVPDES